MAPRYNLHVGRAIEASNSRDLGGCLWSVLPRISRISRIRRLTLLRMTNLNKMPRQETAHFLPGRARRLEESGLQLLFVFAISADPAECEAAQRTPLTLF
jgi:hypothetical protein